MKNNSVINGDGSHTYSTDDEGHSGRKEGHGGSSDREVLVDVPLSFELAGFEPLPVATRGAYIPTWRRLDEMIGSMCVLPDLNLF